MHSIEKQGHLLPVLRVFPLGNAFKRLQDTSTAPPLNILAAFKFCNPHTFEQKVHEKILPARAEFCRPIFSNDFFFTMKLAPMNMQDVTARIVPIRRLYSECSMLTIDAVVGIILVDKDSDITLPVDTIVDDDDMVEE